MWFHLGAMIMNVSGQKKLERRSYMVKREPMHLEEAREGTDLVHEAREELVLEVDLRRTVKRQSGK
jgi:hypothetical protein